LISLFLIPQATWIIVCGIILILCDTGGIHWFLLSLILQRRSEIA
jgi:hypothetical protein